MLAPGPCYSMLVWACRSWLVGESKQERSLLLLDEGLLDSGKYCSGYRSTTESTQANQYFSMMWQYLETLGVVDSKSSESFRHCQLITLMQYIHHSIYPCTRSPDHQGGDHQGVIVMHSRLFASSLPVKLWTYEPAMPFESFRGVSCISSMSQSLLHLSSHSITNDKAPMMTPMAMADRSSCSSVPWSVTFSMACYENSREAIASVVWLLRIPYDALVLMILGNGQHISLTIHIDQPFWQVLASPTPPKVLLSQLQKRLTLCERPVAGWMVQLMVNSPALVMVRSLNITYLPYHDELSNILKTVMRRVVISNILKP